MDNSEIGRISEIDRTEHITLGYFMRDGELVSKEVDWRVPQWPLEGPDDFSVTGLIKMLTPILESAGIMIGAFDGERLIGCAVLRPHLTGKQAQLAVLHVSDGYRRRGVGTSLEAEVEQLAMEAGARELYVSATPSESAVGFYLSQGFHLAEEVNQELYKLEPEDIHMIKIL